MAARQLTRKSPNLALQRDADDIALLRKQLSSLQLAVESRERAANKLRDEAENILRSMGPHGSLFARNLPCVAYLKDESGRYIFANHLWETVHQKTFRDWYRRTDHDLFPSDLADSRRRSDLEVTHTGLPKQSVYVQTADGQNTSWLVSKFPVQTATGASGFIGGVAVDITGLSQTEQALAETEEFYRDIFTSVLIGVEKPSPEGRILLGNPAAVRNRDRAEILEKDRNHLLELVARNESITVILTELCVLVERQFPGGICSVMLRCDDVLEVAAGPNISKAFEAELLPGIAIGPNTGSRGTAAFRAEPVIVMDTSLDPQWADYRDLAIRHNVKSSWNIPIFSGERKVLGAIGVYHSISTQPAAAELELLEMAGCLAAIALEHRQLLADLEHGAKFDSLTGLPNRSLLEDRLESALDAVRGTTARLSLLWIDLDRFRETNDTLGHRIGDVLLRQAAQRLSRCCEPSETLARMGGDEFALLVTQISKRSDAEDRAESILAVLRQPFYIEGHELYVTASMGICTYPEDGLDSTTLQGNADRAMYRAKSRGRNGYHLYEREIGSGALERLTLESNMRHALEREEFELFYQPQVNLEGGLMGFEALLRWNHPKHGLLCPGDFISIAEESGLIIPIGAWVVKQACRQLAVWKHASPALKIAVNVSALQFYYADFVDTVRQDLAAANIDPGALEIELTETLVMRDFEESVRQLERLRALGIGIAIDDFGTGYSCLSNLLRLPVNTLKIDRSFVTEIERSANTAVVTAISMLSRNLGLSVVAEGIEHAGQWEAIKKIGVDLVQGYLVGRPQPAGITEDRFFHPNSRTANPPLTTPDKRDQMPRQI